MNSSVTMPLEKKGDIFEVVELEEISAVWIEDIADYPLMELVRERAPTEACEINAIELRRLKRKGN